MPRKFGTWSEPWWPTPTNPTRTTCSAGAAKSAGSGAGGGGAVAAAGAAPAPQPLKPSPAPAAASAFRNSRRSRVLLIWLSEDCDDECVNLVRLSVALLRDSAAVQQVMVTRASPESARSSADALDEMGYRWITASRSE